MTNVRDCEIYCGPIDGSVFVNDCTNCRFVLASRQLRIHDTINCVFEVQTNSGPIIEDCDHLRFGPYPQISYNQSDLDFRESTLDMSVKNAWCDVKDFKWHRTQASPHWSKLDIRDRRGDLKDAKSLGISFVDVLNASKSPSIVAATNTTTTTTTLNEDKSSDEEL